MKKRNRLESCLMQICCLWSEPSRISQIAFVEGTALFILDEQRFALLISYTESAVSQIPTNALK